MLSRQSRSSSSVEIFSLKTTKATTSSPHSLCGRPTTELKQLRPFRGHGTTIYFEPDPDIFKSTQFDAALIRNRLEDMSYIHSGLKITFKNDVTKEVLDLTHPGGIPEFLERLIAEGQKAFSSGKRIEWRLR